MALPRLEDVNEQTDREFKERFSDAPERLDPQAPEHATWVEEWGQIRAQVAERWTDDVFSEFYPIGRKLDSNDPADAAYVDYWLDIRDQLNGEPGRYDWSGSGPAVVPAATDYDQSGSDQTGYDQAAFDQTVAAGGTADVAAPQGTFTVHPDQNMDEAELVEQAFKNELEIIDQWREALDNFETVMNSATESEAKPQFAQAMLAVFAEKALGKFAEVMKADLVIDTLKAVIEEGERASKAATSVALRDFIVSHRNHLSNISALLTADSGRRAADSRAKAEELLRTDPDAYGMYRLMLMDLNDDTARRLGEAKPDALFGLLTQEWVTEAVTGRFVLRIDEATLAVKNIRLEATDGHKLLEQMLKQPDGLDIWPMDIPKWFIYFEGDAAKGEVHVDEQNRDVTIPAAQFPRSKAVFNRLHAQNGPGRLGPGHWADS